MRPRVFPSSTTIPGVVAAIFFLASNCPTSHALLRGSQDNHEDSSAVELGNRNLISYRYGSMTSIAGSRSMTSLYGTTKLGLCERGCESNSQCDYGLFCYERSVFFESAPGCPTAVNNPSTENYCIDINMVAVLPPTDAPMKSPTKSPTKRPTSPPTKSPTETPTKSPTKAPTESPTGSPTATPTKSPTESPTPAPTKAPTKAPITKNPTRAPSPFPTMAPSASMERDTGNALMNTIRSRLLPYALGAGNDFVTVESYTYQALERMSAILDIDSVSDAKLIQFYALYCIYEATNGKSNWVTEADPRFDSLPTIPGWLVSNGWDNRVSNSVAALDPCTTSWYGITCDSSSRIIKIELASNLLIGQFPAEIILLGSDGAYGTGAGNLNRLDLFGNEFLVNYDDNAAAAAVPEPNWWWKHLGSNFEHFYFGSTSFGGNLGRLPTHLREFDGSYTLLSGGFINANFDGLNQLEYLVLDGNFLDSSVPTALNQLAKLQYLYIADSGITGDLSYLQQGMPSLREHWIDFNPALRGPIPTQVGDMQSLQSLSMTRNGLWGTVPSELGSLTSLKHLWLSGNLFGGLIPTQLSQLQQLQTLQLEGNRFYASMPDEICTLADRFGSSLSVMGVDCSEVSCPCCTCCSYEECNPDLV